MTEVIIKEVTYDIKIGDARVQLFVSRKITPFLQSWNSQSKSLDEAFSDIDEETMDSIWKKVLPFVKRKVGDNWFPVYYQASNTIAYDDIDGPVLQSLFFKILEIYIAPFYQGVAQQE